MGTIKIQEETTKNPIELMGKEAGICWGADTENKEKNIKRGKDCLENGHMRVAEYPQVYLVLSGYSARVIRELYTHIGGMPTRLQASTRYIDYDNFKFVVPNSVSSNTNGKRIYESVMNNIITGYESLLKAGVPIEDAANILPLGMETKVVLRTNLRNLIDMSRQRMCMRAYSEFRQLMNDIINALCSYSVEWKYLTETYFYPKCAYLSYCPEKKSCKLYGSKLDK